MNATYGTGKRREANKSYWLIIDIAILYRQYRGMIIVVFFLMNALSDL